MLKLATFLHAHRLLRPTGVGKHIRETMRRLNRRDDVSLRLTASRRQLQSKEVQAELRALGLDEVHPIRISRKPLEIAWRLLDTPKFDRWAGDAEWFYSPAEVYVPTRRLKRAITVHCINWFDPELPWYNDPATVAARRRMRFLFERIAQRSDLVLSVSDYLSGRLIHLFGVEPDRIAVVGNGVEEAYFKAGRNLPPESTQPPYLIVVGGLTTRKNGSLIVEMAQRLASFIPDLRIKVVGNSEPQHLQASLAHNNIEHLGYVGINDGLVELVHGAQALLFPSRCETFGIPAVEAMAAGTVPIVSAHAALPGLVGDAGLIIPDDPAASAELIADLLCDPAAIRQRAALSRTLAAEHTWDRVVERVIEAIRSRG